MSEYGGNFPLITIQPKTAAVKHQFRIAPGQGFWYHQGIKNEDGGGIDMKLGLVTDSLADRSLAEAAAVCRGLGLEQVEPVSYTHLTLPTSCKV